MAHFSLRDVESEEGGRGQGRKEDKGETMEVERDNSKALTHSQNHKTFAYNPRTVIGEGKSSGTGTYEGASAPREDRLQCTS